MKDLLFLDIDGVARPNVMPNDYQLRPDLCANIVLAAKKFDLSIVITSNWRSLYSIKYFNSKFDQLVAGVTPDLNLDGNCTNPREREINVYLNSLRDRPKKYFVLDDKKSLFSDQMKGLFICNSMVGFDANALNQFISFAKG